MLSKSKIKHIQSLGRKRYRQQNGLYIVEGEKIIHEYLVNGAAVKMIYATADWLGDNERLLAKNDIPFTEVSGKELSRISSLTTPNSVLATVHIPVSDSDPLKKDGLYLALESLRDPGNMGTIIRMADWFGLAGILCSEDCVDVYNPKVVQATMGSLIRVPISYVNLEKVLAQDRLKVYAATLDGEHIRESQPSQQGIILIGNEAQGLSDALLRLSSKKLSIPKYGKAESLNAAIAAGIIVAWFRG